MAQTVSVIVGAEDRARLAAILGDRNRPQKHVQRATLIVLSAERLPVLEVARRAGVSRPAVWRWQVHYAEQGVDGLLRDKTRKPGKAPLPPATVAKVLALTCSEPPRAVTHWTGRAMAQVVGISLRAVQRIWEANRLQPHRLRTFKRSTDPAFAAKVEDIVGLYMDPPCHAVVLSIDEKSQIQALDRTQPGLPLKPGKCGTMTHDYKRNGTTTLFAALNTLDGTVVGRCMPKHTHKEVHHIPHRGGADRSGGQGDPRHRRQLRHAQAPQGGGLAGESPALGLSLHAKVGLLDQRRRGLLLDHHATEHPARRVQVRARPAGRHHPLHPCAQQAGQALRLDQARRRHPRQTRPAACTFRMSQCN